MFVDVPSDIGLDYGADAQVRPLQRYGDVSNGVNDISASCSFDMDAEPGDIPLDDGSVDFHDNDAKCAVASDNNKATTGEKRKKLELRRVTSKKYRDSLGELYGELVDLLPAVYPEENPRTKSKIIQLTGDAVRKLKSEVAVLEARYIVSSPTNRSKWIDRVVRSATNFPAAAVAFMRLMVLHGWSYSELWCCNVSCDGTSTFSAPQLVVGISNSDLGKPTAISSCTAAYKLEAMVSLYDGSGAQMPEPLSRFVALSKHLTFTEGDGSFVGRILQTLSAEWVVFDELKSSKGYTHIEHASQAGFKACFALPLLLRGHVAAAVLFYNYSYSQHVRLHLGIAEDIGAALGNCYGALRKPSEDFSSTRMSAKDPSAGWKEPVVAFSENVLETL